MQNPTENHQPVKLMDLSWILTQGSHLSLNRTDAAPLRTNVTLLQQRHVSRHCCVTPETMTIAHSSTYHSHACAYGLSYAQYY